MIIDQAPGLEADLKRISPICSAHFKSSNMELFYPGLTRRELFAAMAMQGYLSSPLLDKSGTASITQRIAFHAVQMADAMCAKLDEKIEGI